MVVARENPRSESGDPRQFQAYVDREQDEPEEVVRKTKTLAERVAEHEKNTKTPETTSPLK